MDWYVAVSTVDSHWHFCWYCLSGKSLSDDQTLPNHQLSTQSEPGTVERQVEGTKAKETASTTKLNRGEWSVKYARVCLFTRAIYPIKYVVHRRNKEAWSSSNSTTQNTHWLCKYTFLAPQLHGWSHCLMMLLLKQNQIPSVQVMVHNVVFVECAWLWNKMDLLTRHIYQRGLFDCGKYLLTFTHIFPPLYP